MNRHTVYQQNGLKSFIDYNNRGDIEMNSDLNNCDASRGIGLINILSQNFNDMDWGV